MMEERYTIDDFKKTKCCLTCYYWNVDITHCDILRECMPYEGRRPDCPLKPVEKGGDEE